MVDSFIIIFILLLMTSFIITVGIMLITDEEDKD